MKNLLLLSTLFIISGCATLFGGKDVDVTKYQSVDEMVNSELSKERLVNFLSTDEINPFSKGKAFSPKRALENFCTQIESGELTQLESEKIYNNPDNINSYIGLFECKSPEGSWLARVKTRPIQNPTDPQLRLSRHISTSMVKDSDYAYQQQYKQRERSRRMEQERAFQEKVNGLVSASKSRGQMVCTMDNRFGYVEDIDGQRIKVLVKGKAAYTSDGYLFKNPDQQFGFRKIDEYIWDESKHWGLCLDSI
ncbi:MAG: hypothetical protein ACQEV6_00370 [Pseudomonadota bacterium]